jgi:CRP-like cAMP-binding protein
MPAATLRGDPRMRTGNHRWCMAIGIRQGLAQPSSERRPDESRNRLLASLAPEDRARLGRRMQLVGLSSGQHIVDSMAPVRTVLFPESAVVSMIASMRDGTSVEVATIGVEGMVGLPAFLGTGSLPMTVLAQVPGDAWRLDADVFRHELTRNETLRDAINRYIQGLIVQIAQTVACNRLHPVGERAARWLLMTADRVGADEFHLTQEFLATMLGVHRPSVTVAAGELQRDGAISYHRGNVRILDRDQLEGAACECYRVIRTEFDRLMGRSTADSWQER